MPVLAPWVAHWSPVLTGGLAGASAGAASQLVRNALTGAPLGQNVWEMTAAGIVGGMAGGFALSRLPSATGLLPRMLVGAGTSALVGGGMYAPTNLVQGQPWHQGVIKAADVQAARARPGGAEEVEWTGKRGDDWLDLPDDVAGQLASQSPRRLPDPELLGLPSRAEGQALIDDIVRNEFRNVRLTQDVEYNPYMDIEDPGKFGRSQPGRPSEIAPRSIRAGHGETIDTIAHEEMHHRIWESEARQEWL